MNKKSSPTFFEKLSRRTGRWYPILILLFIQFINTPLFILLTAMPAQQNTEMSKIQGYQRVDFRHHSGFAPECLAAYSVLSL